MESNELRIGNYFIDEDGELVQLEEKHFNWIDWSYCRPIPLTEEWLVKFGIYLDFIEGDYYESEVYIKNEKYNYIIYSFENQYGIFDYIEKEVEYVHEIQNLYFALEKKELNLLE